MNDLALRILHALSTGAADEYIKLAECCNAAHESCKLRCVWLDRHGYLTRVRKGNGNRTRLELTLKGRAEALNCPTWTESAAIMLARCLGYGAVL